ncbi:hypothetical protein B4U80_08821 [Leptotrombidium deliense]|uniref:Granulins domain-containing protein n=1 Tax=Leptotrombidium deliense TaxID=299467 RepID=A0A443S242_9ACAR|nr:hypothetical protein B4U80_08821 [Leptotrombidium deliense]
MRNILFSVVCLLFANLVLAKQCPDSSQCVDDDSTCCKLRSGHYGCCPLPNAVCCTDGFHCCPEGTKCDEKNGTCVHEMQQIRRSLSKSISLNTVENIICPDGKEQCLDSQTCCELQSGQYGCCPYEKGVCCSDEEHCCPNGFACDVRHSRCIHQEFNTAIVPKMLARFNSTISSVICPDKTSQCPDGNTCCQMEGGEWGCCPLESAVCCEDKVHCCPHGTKCAEGGCVQP